MVQDSTKSNDINWQVGDYAFVQGLGIYKISEVTKGGTPSSDYFHMQRIPEDDTSHDMPRVKVDRPKLYRPFTREQLEEAIKQANLPQEPRFENLNELEEHMVTC